jgi:hypothetical protein
VKEQQLFPLCGQSIPSIRKPRRSQLYAGHKDRYGRRKLGERHFGNAEKRSLKCYYRKDKSTT